jgi:hypothetical protein
VEKESEACADLLSDELSRAVDSLALQPAIGAKKHVAKDSLASRGCCTSLSAATSTTEFGHAFGESRYSLSGMLTAAPRLDFDSRFAVCRGGRVEIASGDRFFRREGFRGKPPSE